MESTTSRVTPLREPDLTVGDEPGAGVARTAQIPLVQRRDVDVRGIAVERCRGYVIVAQLGHHRLRGMRIELDQLSS